MARSKANKGGPLPVAEPCPITTPTPTRTAEEKANFAALVYATGYALMSESTGPFANPVRAAEIALMDEFALAEFTELTGVGVGDHGIYRVGPTGISLPVSEMLGSITPVEQNAIHQAERNLTFLFPCKPARFLEWYEATRGDKAHPHAPAGARPISDFPLADGFVAALAVGDGTVKAAREDSVPSPEIISAFRVKPDTVENKQWWDDRMRHASRYRLKVARASVGRAGIPSRWDLLQIAVWLVGKGHLSPERVRAAVEEHFPKFDSTFL